MDLFEIKKPLCFNRYHPESEKTTHGIEENFTVEELKDTLQLKNILQFHYGKTDNPIFKWTKNLILYLLKEDIQDVKRHMKT